MKEPTMAQTNTFTGPISDKQAERLRGILKDRGFEFKERPYTVFAAAKGKLQIAVYEKGPKILVQGKETEDFVRFTLEPEVFQEIRMGYEEERFPEMFKPHFGIDESGKGDYFGPLVISGVYTDAAITRVLLDIGVCDSKKIGSDARIRKLADAIRKVPEVVFRTVMIGPKRYNEIYASLRNLNRLLAWGHATAIARLLEAVPGCKRALSDQFARKSLLEDIVYKEKKLDIELEQRHRAEDDTAVAAASVLARERCLRWMEARSEVLGRDLPRGASLEVQNLAAELEENLGPSGFSEIAKTHFGK